MFNFCAKPVLIATCFPPIWKTETTSWKFDWKFDVKLWTQFTKAEKLRLVPVLVDRG